MRENKMDNIRFVLIFLVALGHFFEVSVSGTLKNATELIYSFHMPVFVFVSGYFAKFNPKRIVRTYLYCGILMQVLYYFFLKYYIGNGAMEIQYSIPYYTLWYLFAMAFYTMIVPLIETDSLGRKIAILVISFAISLIAGTDPGVGYPFASGRFFAFLPFFVLGFYCKNMGITQKLAGIKLRYKALGGAILLAAVAAFEFYIIKNPYIEFIDMTYSYPYDQTMIGWKARAILLAGGLLWIAFFLVATPNKRIPLVSSIGANTLPIYIFHGFVVKILIDCGLINLSPKIYAPVAVAVSFLFLLVFGNKIASNVAKWGFTGHWLSLFDKKTK